MLFLFLFFNLILLLVNASSLRDYDDIYLLDFEMSQDMGENGDKFEGDLVLSNAQRLALAAVAEGNSRNGLQDSTKRWPHNLVTYYIETEDFNDDQIKSIEQAMDDIANISCIKFISRKNEDEHAVIIQHSADGCFSNVGYNSDEDEEENQVLNLSKGCFAHGTIVHEMLHTLGFYHMQSTHNRDDYVQINWENISPGKEQNFAKYNSDYVIDFGVPYDYGSVMHYGETAFSKNGNKTIVPLQENVKLGQRKGLSESDILKLNKMYCGESEK